MKQREHLLLTQFTIRSLLREVYTMKVLFHLLSQLCSDIMAPFLPMDKLDAEKPIP